MEKTPTYDDFEDLVRERLRHYLSNVSDKEFDKYMNDEETQEEIREKYEDGLEKYKSGEVTYKVFTNGCVSSVVWCLNLLYDGPFDAVK